MPEEGRLILQNWNTLCQYPLFASLPDLFKQVTISLSPGLITTTLSIIDQQLTAYDKFEHCYPLAGIVGLLVLLSNTHSLEANLQYQKCVKSLRGKCHFESLYGCVNVGECKCVNELTGWSKNPLKDARERLKSKSKYIKHMNELSVILASLDSTCYQIDPLTIISTLHEAFSLYQRISLILSFICIGVTMSIEAFIFICNNRGKWKEIKDKMWTYIMSLQLSLYRLQQALFHNPTLQRLLPILFTSLLNALTTDLGSPAVTKEYITEHLFCEDSLLWLTLTGVEDMSKDKEYDRIHGYFVLHHLYHSYQHHYSLMNLGHSLFFDLKELAFFLQMNPSASKVKSIINTFTSTLNEESRLLDPLPSPRKESFLYHSIIQ